MNLENSKEYNYKEGFAIKPRRSHGGVFFAMGDTHVAEIKVFDLYQGKEFIKTYETFGEAKDAGMEISLGERRAITPLTLSRYAYTSKYQATPSLRRKAVRG
jgi:hypothetical protein